MTHHDRGGNVPARRDIVLTPERVCECCGIPIARCWNCGRLFPRTRSDKKTCDDTCRKALQRRLDGGPFYRILGIPKGATEQQIDRAYRRLAKENHPDQSGDRERFEMVQAAYEIVSGKRPDPRYDLGYLFRYLIADERPWWERW